MPVGGNLRDSSGGDASFGGRIGGTRIDKNYKIINKENCFQTRNMFQVNGT